MNPNAPTIVAEVGSLDGVAIAVAVYGSGHVAIVDPKRLTHAGYTLNSEQALELARALERAADPATRAAIQEAKRQLAESTGQH